MPLQLNSDDDHHHSGIRYATDYTDTCFLVKINIFLETVDNEITQYITNVRNDAKRKTGDDQIKSEWIPHIAEQEWFVISIIFASVVFNERMTNRQKWILSQFRWRAQKQCCQIIYRVRGAAGVCFIPLTHNCNLFSIHCRSAKTFLIVFVCCQPTNTLSIKSSIKNITISFMWWWMSIKMQLTIISTQLNAICFIFVVHRKKEGEIQNEKNERMWRDKNFGDFDGLVV